MKRVFTEGSRLVCGLVAAAVAYGLFRGAADILYPDLAAWVARLGPVWAVGAALVAAALARAGVAPGRLLMRVPAPVFAGAAFALALAGGIFAHFAILKGVPDIPDEFSYLHQARGFADGFLAPPSPELPDFYYVSWGVHDHGHWYSVFPPGFGLLLAVGVKLGVPWLVNPLLGAFLPVALFALAREVFGGDGLAPRAGVILLLCSWFPLLHAGSYMSHPTAALLTVLACLGAWRGVLAGGSLGWSAAGGAALAALMATRPLNAVILGVALLPPLLYVLLVRRAPVRRLLPALAAMAPILLAYGLYNRALTGSATLPPQERYMQLKEERGDCFRLGFGPGVGQCPITQGTNFGKDGFQPKDALQNSGRRLDAYLRYSFALAPLAALPALGALLGALGAAPRRRAWLCFVLLAGIGGYGLFFYHGVAYGARFLYETFPFVCLLGAAFVTDAAGALGRWPLWRAAAGGLLLGILAGGLVATYPAIQKHAGNRKRTNDGADLASLRAPELAGAVVFSDSMVIPAAMTLHPGRVDDNHPLVVRDNGDAADAGFLRLHPGRKAYRMAGSRVFALRLPAEAPIRDEGGALYPLEIAENGFGDRVPNEAVFRLGLSAGEALRFRGRTAGARFAFPTYAIDEGSGLRLALVAYPQGQPVDVLVDGQPAGAAIDTRADKPAVVVSSVPVTLARGRHWIELRLSKPGTVYLDYAELGR